jgi:hypothetical protein
MNVDYAWVLLVAGYSDEINVVCEDYGLFLDSSFKLFFVG